MTAEVEQTLTLIVRWLITAGYPEAARALLGKLCE
jgi:hypothetical protein